MKENSQNQKKWLVRVTRFILILYIGMVSLEIYKYVVGEIGDPEDLLSQFLLDLEDVI